jgi:hypothetical protein
LIELSIGQKADCLFVCLLFIYGHEYLINIYDQGPQLTALFGPQNFELLLGGENRHFSQPNVDNCTKI